MERSDVDCDATAADVVEAVDDGGDIGHCDHWENNCWDRCEWVLLVQEWRWSWAEGCDKKLLL
eukprot:6600257-Ditylum_brightwellii.AAC.1